MAEAITQSDHFTYRDYLHWAEDERWELIEGRAFAMSPAPGLAHQTVVGEIFLQIGGFLADKPCRAFVAPFDVRLPQGAEADQEVTSVVQPDILVVCDESKLDERGCRGAPDWIIEVLSPTTAAKDQIEKLALYEKHGVREYWPVHPTDRVLSVYRSGPDGCFGRAEVRETKGQYAVAQFEGLEIDWDRVFARL